MNSRILIAKVLLWIAALAALAAAVSAWPDVTGASPDTKVVEAWRTIGFVTFAGLFALLAWRPLQSRGLWLVVILNKLALVVMGWLLMNQGGVKGVGDVLVFDGGLVVLLVIAFGLTYWRRESP